MAIQNKLEAARSASSPSVSSSNNSQQSGQKLRQDLPIYTRQDAGRRPVNNSMGQAGYPIGSNRASNISVRERVRQYEQNLNAPGSIGFGNSQSTQAYSNMQPAAAHMNMQRSQPYGSQQSQYYDPQQGRNYGSQESRNYDQPQVQYYDPQQGQNYSAHQNRNYGSQQVQNYGAQESRNYNPPQVQYYEPQQGQNYGSQQGQNYGAQQGRNYGPQQGLNFTSRPFSSPGELASYQEEVERLMSHPNRREISVPFGWPMGVFTTPAGSGIEVGRMQPGTIEFNQFPVGVSSFSAPAYGSQNAQQVPPNQAQRDLPIIIRM